jgi:predicted negative regulator of RcsB-dependent stress response
MNDKINIGITEDEDLVRAKAWWKENGSSIIGGVLIGTVMVVGYNFWQSYQEKHASEVAALYADYNNNPDDSAALDALLEVDDKATYTQLARLTAAKVAMEAGNLELSESLLQGILDSRSDDSLRSVAVLRLANVYLANNEPDAALALLDGQSSTGLPLFQARVQELQGDTYLQKGDAGKAASFYASSIASMELLGQPYALIELKLDNL